MLKAGYDVALLDYEPNNGKKDIKDIVMDLAHNFKHLVERFDDYDLSKDKIVITGDSAGGHLALLFSEALQSKEVRDALGVDLPELEVIATVVACPAFNFEMLGETELTNRARKRMLGPKYKDVEHLKVYSPKTYLEKITNPIFLSTCKNDFIREESLKLNTCLKDKKEYQFMDIQSDKKEVDHVHNVVKIYLEESKQVNNAIIAFVNNLLNK